MSFEEEFPSLKNTTNIDGEGFTRYQEYLLKKYCLDKEQVRKQLDYWIGSLDDDWAIRSIKKELGL